MEVVEKKEVHIYGNIAAMKRMNLGKECSPRVARDAKSCPPRREAITQREVYIEEA